MIEKYKTMEETGGPAFPCTNHHGHKLTGMTLRDYFASKAMQILMSNSGGYWSKEHLKTYADVAYEMAEAMLEARK
jgi:hypothetical protein